MIELKGKIAGPVVKWAGGKSKLAPVIDGYLEGYKIDISEIDTYVEPFIGGGGMFFYMAQKYEFKNKVISDVNLELINLYRVIKERPVDLMKEMKRLEDEYNALENLEHQSEYYYVIREKFNDNIKNLVSDDLHVIQAAYFIFLNKTCFNGLYRVNGKGLYNVPFGKRVKVTLYDEDNILAVSAILQNTDILCGDYHDSLRFAGDSTLFYFDPPYRPLSSSSSFTSYAKSNFNDESQKGLAVFCKEIYEKQAKFALSNSDPKNSNEEDDFFDDLYRDFSIERLSVGRNIGAGAATRKKVNEILVIGN